MKIQHKIEINKFVIETIMVTNEVMQGLWMEEGGEEGAVVSGMFRPTEMKIYLQKSVSVVMDTLSLVNKDLVAFSNNRIRCFV